MEPRTCSSLLRSAFFFPSSVLVPGFDGGLWRLDSSGPFFYEIYPKHMHDLSYLPLQYSTKLVQLLVLVIWEVTLSYWWHPPRRNHAFHSVSSDHKTTVQHSWCIYNTPPNLRIPTTVILVRVSFSLWWSAFKKSRWRDWDGSSSWVGFFWIDAPMVDCYDDDDSNPFMEMLVVGAFGVWV